MRVALITDGIWPYVLGGMQKHSYYICKYLAQNKIYVDLFHYNQSNYDISTLDVFTDKERKFIRSYVVKMPRSLPFPGHYVYNSYRHSKLIYNAIKDKLSEYDFIYTKGFTGWYLLEMKAAGKIKCPPIGVKFHGYEMFQKPPDLKTKLQHVILLRSPVKIITLKADVVFSYGGKITEIVKSLGVAQKQIYELPSGVERSTIIDEVRPVKNKVRFLYLGRYERRKGIEELNKAIKTILAQDASVKASFHFVGPIPKSKQLRNKAISYHGEIRNKQKLQELIRQNDVLICPSWSEGMPNVLLEAMANGLAVLATDVGANSVLVNESTGWIINNPQPQDIETAIKKIISSTPESINEKKKSALELISNNFTWEKLIHNFIETFLRPKKK